ncbi:MAG: hypothetical protein M3P26_04170 [Gemmatimonadota bacterium]|nr:hypothetical protein [Gemmatimonadota bacterium]
MEKLDLDPSALHWVSTPKGPENAPIVNLSPGLFDFVDLIEYTLHNNGHVLAVADPRPRGFGFQPPNANGEFVLTITVVAENAASLTKHVHYTLTRDNLFSDVRLQDSGPADYRFAGLPHNDSADATG